MAPAPRVRAPKVSKEPTKGNSEVDRNPAEVLLEETAKRVQGATLSVCAMWEGQRVDLPDEATEAAEATALVTDAAVPAKMRRKG